MQTFLAVAAVVSLSSSALAFADPPEVTFSDLMKATATRETLAELGRSFQKELAKVLRSPFARRLFSKAFAPEAFVKSAVAIYRSGFNPGHAAKVVGWYRSPIGTRVRAIHLQQPTPEQEEEKRVFLEALEKLPAPAERVDLVRRLLRASGLKALRGLLMQFLNGFFQGLPGAPEGMVRGAQKKLMGWNVRGESLVGGFLFAYRSLSSAELRRYVEYLETAHGRWFSDVSLRATRRGLFLMGKRSATTLLKLTKARRSH